MKVVLSDRMLYQILFTWSNYGATEVIRRSYIVDARDCGMTKRLVTQMGSWGKDASRAMEKRKVHKAHF